MPLYFPRGVIEAWMLKQGFILQNPGVFQRAIGQRINHETHLCDVLHVGLKDNRFKVDYALFEIGSKNPPLHQFDIEANYFRIQWLLHQLPTLMSQPKPEYELSDRAINLVNGVLHNPVNGVDPVLVEGQIQTLIAYLESTERKQAVERFVSKLRADEQDDGSMHYYLDQEFY